MPSKSTKAPYSIGDLAEATGIAPDTIRVWERRYGRPVPVRLPKGHRRYTQAHVRWLRRVAEALARGHRPGKVVPASDRELDGLLAAPNGSAPPRRVETLLGLVADYDRTGVERRLRKAWDDLGPRRFLNEVAGPLVTEVGRRWADGTMEVRHEHFLTEVLEDVFRSLRVSVKKRARKDGLLLATLPGEPHGLGLQMVALLCAVVGVRTRILGPETPLDEIVSAVEETGAHAVGVSVSLSSGGVETDRLLAELRDLLPEDVRILVGGRGARGVRRGPRGIDYAEGLDALEAWLADL